MVFNFQWFPCQREVLAALPVLPECLTGALADPPQSPRHLVCIEDGIL